MIQTQVQYNSTQYDRIRALGKGSFGTATVHRRRADCSLVVLKEIDLQKFKGEREKMSAINEARIMSTLSHVNIIKYHNAYTTETKLIIEMEYASIGTLANYLTFQMQPLEELEVLIIFRQIVSGVQYLHSKDIVHLDLKMTNIFITIEGLIKIGDFGISQYMNTVSSSSIGNSGKISQQQQLAPSDSPKKRKAAPAPSSHLGTLAYSSPERCSGEPTDLKSDIWSLGCLLYELITAKPLFVGASLPDLVLSITRIQYAPIKRQIMPLLHETFEQTIARDPEDRPTAKELLCITGQLLSRLQQSTRNKNHQMRYQNHHRAFELSTEVALFTGHQQDDMMNQLNYLHSLVYQVRLDSKHIRVDRVNLPQTKRIREICKGKSHYLVLTYDNIVYGWGSKTHGQLGACGLSSSNSYGTSTSLATASSSLIGYRTTLSARSSVKEAKDLLQMKSSSTAASSPASSSQTIATTYVGSNTKASSHHLSKQLVMSILKESRPTTRPFIINELNHRKIIQVAAGKNFSVFLSRTGIVMTCGDGSSGCLGRGDLSSSFTPCMVEGLLNADVVFIGCGPEHVVAVCGNGRAFSWGNSGQGRLGISGAGGRKSSAAEATDDNNEPISLSVNGELGPKVNSRAGKYVLRPEPVRFDGNVFIKRVFCGDRCTIFIDSDNKCWACGENRFNKLGLDIKRRFKKSLIVERCFYPTEIEALCRHKIVTCNIGKNHTSFISNEGKLLVFGQDIDHNYRLRNNIISSRDSHRRISYELQSRKFRRKNPPQCSPSQTHGLNLNESRTSSRLTVASNLAKATKRFNGELNKLQRQQMDSYIKKSRSSRRMPFDRTIGVSCRPKFTLVLTSDNRVYFWGVRSHKKEEEGAGNRISCSASRTRLSRTKHNESIEPQLVANCPEECFIKIGETNNSLMSSIQTLGSDQPIIQAQDPRLMAKSLADLWILDYQPSRDDSTSASSSRSSLDNLSVISSSSLTSCCSISPCSLCGPRGSFSQASLATSAQDDENIRRLRSWRQQQSSLTSHCRSHGRERPSLYGAETYYDKIGDYMEDCMRHDAILEPQPILSLYVPSMFNHKGCSLNLVDLFCFDDDRFYLILDTSIKLQQTQGNHSRPPSGLATTGVQSPNVAANRRRLMSVNETVARGQIRQQLAQNESLSLVNLHQVVAATSGSQQSSRKLANSTKFDINQLTTMRLEVENNFLSSRQKFSISDHDGIPLKDHLDNDEENTANLDTLKFNTTDQVGDCNKVDLDRCDDENNNEHSMASGFGDGGCSNGGGEILSSSSNGDAGNHNNTNDHTVNSTSQCGVSSEEPRSLSTFATSLGNHIIVGPTMRSLEQQEQTLHPLSFGGSLNRHRDHLYRLTQANFGMADGGQNGVTVHLEERTSESIRCNDDTINGFTSEQNGFNKTGCDNIGTEANKYLRVGRRIRANKSESTTNCASNDIDETSSMPSWVRNEYMEQQHQQDGDDMLHDEDSSQFGAMLELVAVDRSSALVENDTCNRRISLETSSNLTSSDEGQANPDDDEHTATEGQLLDQDSDQTLGHEIYSILGDDMGQHSFKPGYPREPQPHNLSGQLDYNTNLFDEEVHCVSLNYGSGQMHERQLEEAGSFKVAEFEMKKPRAQLTISKSHPNIRQLDQEREQIDSDSILRRASILLDNNHEAAASSQANILDCNVYRASVAHKATKLQHNVESNSISHTNGTTMIYNGPHNHHHQQSLHLSSNLLNSALSSRSNSHNPLIRADFNPRLGFLKEQDPRHSSQICSESHLGLPNGGHRNRDQLVDNAKATSSSSIGSLRKSLAKLFC